MRNIHPLLQGGSGSETKVCVWVGVGAVRFRHSHYISGLYTGGQGIRKADSTELYMPKCVSLDVFQLRISGRFFNSGQPFN